LNNIYCFTSIDTYYTPNTFDVALEAVGTIKRLLDWLWISSDSANGCSYAFALVRPPGHHCANDPNGFCIFNNVFAGTKYAQSLGWKKVLILDVDFHHGDGTEKLIRAASDPNISFVSIHSTWAYRLSSTDNSIRFDKNRAFRSGLLRARRSSIQRSYLRLTCKKLCSIR
jgi:acetoin utilization deacetylase AcuC-like enzyme